jgi:hypothetical protein
MVGKKRSATLDERSIMPEWETTEELSAISRYANFSRGMCKGSGIL